MSITITKQQLLFAQSILDRILNSGLKNPKLQIQTSDPEIILEIEQIAKQGSQKLKHFMDLGKADGTIPLEMRSSTGKASGKQFNHKDGYNCTYLVKGTSPDKEKLTYIPWI